MRKIAIVMLVLAAVALFGCTQKEAVKVTTETTPETTPTHTTGTQSGTESASTGINDTFKDIISEINQIQELEKITQELNTLNFEI
ncbi:MAG: hypothetical protein GXO67_00060 [Archaeoglobi archaeon]|nr:hypothetical protein [Archaeoglobi archaeon]